MAESGSDDKPEFVIGGVPEHFNIPWHMVLNGEPLEGLPVKPVWRDFPGGTGAMCRALASGGLDLAVLLTEGIVKHIHAGGAARIVGTYTDTPLVWGVHVAKGGEIRSMEDLKDARYAISRFGSGSNLMAALDAAQRGWDEPSYVIVGNLEGGREALADGSADAFMWEKTMSLPVVLDGDWRRVADFAGPWPAFVIAASERALKRGLDWLPGLLEQVHAACAEADADHDATSAFIGDSYRIPTDAVLGWLDETKWACRPTVSETMLAEVSAILLDAGILEHTMPSSELIAGPEWCES